MSNPVISKKKSSASKRKKSKDDDTVKSICNKHVFSSEQILLFQSELLKWFDKHQRKLPWRDIAREELDPDKRGYAVWVSEIMLQQTQVSTVIPYYTKWMKKWPSVFDLAAANLEEVNKTWAGLGYYSRAKRLHEGASFLAEKKNGHVPQTVAELKDTLPGIGRYTASAISSIAYHSVNGVVDGNVSRVLSRVRAIGCDITIPFAQAHLWELADGIVSKSRPGDFNQALMELGAMVCTPRNPNCDECPLKSLCLVYAMSEKTSQKVDVMIKKKPKRNTKKSKLPDIEDALECHMCIAEETWKQNPSISAFPFKPKKKESRLETVAVVVIERNNCLLTVQRPDTGLLAGLWEFPSIILSEDISSQEKSKNVNTHLSTLGFPSNVSQERQEVGEVLHIFSHIRTTYVVEHLVVNNTLANEPNDAVRWIERKDIDDSAMSTAMKKVLQAVDGKSKKVPSKKRKYPLEADAKQRSIKSFFS